MTIIPTFGNIENIQIRASIFFLPSSFLTIKSEWINNNTYMIVDKKILQSDRKSLNISRDNNSDMQKQPKRSGATLQYYFTYRLYTYMINGKERHAFLDT